MRVFSESFGAGVSAMGDDLPQLKREFGRHLCFQGGVDIQEVMPHGSERQSR